MARFKRPFSTRYYDEKGGEVQAHGACSSEEGAIRATVVRVFIGQWVLAVIHDREADDVPIYTVTRSRAEGIKVHYGSGVPLKRFHRL